MTRKWKTNQTTSKIYKLYINGKPKRPGIHQYPYLGPKVAVVAEKLDPTVGRICFCHIFQTVMNLEKRTTEMSSEGPKMVGERYGSAWNGRKMTKSDDPRWRLPPCSTARSRRVRLWLAVKFHGDGRLVVALLLGCACTVLLAGIDSHGLNPIGLKMGQNDPIRGFRVFWIFSRVLGLDPHLAPKTRLI